MERLSFLTIAGYDKEKAEIMAKYLEAHYIKTKVTNDVIGVEYTAVLKNVYAVACGIAHGLGYGDNFQAVLISNAIREMRRFVKKIHKTKRNISQTVYLGDLLVTSYSLFSRNRMFGNMLGKGYTVKSAQMEMDMIAEGYYAAKSIYELNQSLETRMPILNAVYEVLYEEKNPRNVFKNLVENLN